jgi:hypothetical protein
MISWIFILNIASQGHQRRRKVVEGGPLGSSAWLFGFEFDFGFQNWIELTSHHKHTTVVNTQKKLVRLFVDIFVVLVVLRCLLAFGLPLLSPRLIYYFMYLSIPFASFLFFYLSFSNYLVCNYPVCVFVLVTYSNIVCIILLPVCLLAYFLIPLLTIQHHSLYIFVA